MASIEHTSSPGVEMETGVEPIPRRPGYGTAGTPTHRPLKSNFFRLELPGKDVFFYSFQIVNANPRRGANTLPMPVKKGRQVFAAFIKAHRRIFDGANQFAVSVILRPLTSASFCWVYDGGKEMYTPARLPIGEEETLLVVELPDERPNKPPEKFNVTIMFVERITFAALRCYMQPLEPSAEPPSEPDKALKALQVIMRHYPAMQTEVVTTRRSLYKRNMPRPTDLGDGVEAWNGLTIAARPCAGGLFALADISSGTYMKPNFLHELVQEVLRHTPRRRLLPDQCRDLEKVFKTLKVETAVRANMRRRYRISGITLTPASDTFFRRTVDGREEQISVENYYRQEYNLGLQFPHLPCIIKDGPSGKTYVPVEICKMLPNQRMARKLNPEQTARMIRHAVTRPSDRFNRIQTATNEFLTAPDGPRYSNDHMRAFDVKMATMPTEVPARVLPHPDLVMRTGGFEPADRGNVGVWNLQNKEVYQARTLDEWSIVSFVNQQDFDERRIDKFVKNFAETAGRTGLRIRDIRPALRWGNARDLDSVQRVLRSAAKVGNRWVQLMLVILPTKDAKLYGEVKRVGDTEVGVVTQCLQVSKLMDFERKNGAQFYANVVLKINAKLGGINTILRDGSLDNMIPPRTIVMGADMTHPGPGDRSKPSIAAVVASMDPDITTFAAVSCLQFPYGDPPTRQDAIGEDDLAGMIHELLQKYKARNGFLPERILFYRDGVSSGQFERVRLEETLGIFQGASKSDEFDADGRPVFEYEPKLTFVTVQKRHSARFVPVDPRDGDRKTGNVKAGTVVDRDHVLMDENGFNADALQQLTYRLCYLYARATRSVSIVPPVYYADLVCTRARLYFKDVEWSEVGSSHSLSVDAWRERWNRAKREVEETMYFSELMSIAIV
ncbi:hypothetical protein HK097_011086 [Rhizophlyctis rosea]|uniref:Uncharacterized protein n=1 Tax=Rhizophlyctis rosea TaxID=64517 RepID=A0AAD5S6U3_9FUNG|nr:hypothetical protein HK097_011086 [Rhizophlyctis rosea]